MALRQNNPGGTSPAEVHDNPAKSLIVSSGPVTVCLRPLSASRQHLIDTIPLQQAEGWADRHIANHVNETGYLPPVGVFFTRNGYAPRLR